MNLNELKTLLPNTNNLSDAYLQLKLDEAVDFVKRVCNQDFTVDGVLTLPASVKGIVAQYVDFELQGNAGIKSESIGGMSQTFDSVEERNNALIKKLSSLGLRKLRFKSFGGR
ncbi:phage head-tail connector protein [Lysinibacillus antri]|uniref:Phage head-tail adapter protein n=1 Tax=Lysinibacillus antri TaxID=2498145 RepID=A0A3S0R8D1_9BACI|nr:phage head-tail connector protein [Lysinibacillus antri]RUL56468.1 hypothetical protein EK386_02210 [Lysinibacillus antri]